MYEVTPDLLDDKAPALTNGALAISICRLAFVYLRAGWCSYVCV